MEELKQQVAQLSAQVQEVGRRVDKLENGDERHDKDIRQLYAAHEGTKAYVTQILSKLDQLEAKLFALITQLTTSQKEDRRAEREERSKWQDLVKYIIGGTVVAVVAILAYLVKGK